jgi:hypothetical protein
MSIISLAKRPTAITGGSNSSVIYGVPGTLVYSGFIGSDRHVADTIGNIYFISVSCNSVYKLTPPQNTPVLFAGSGNGSYGSVHGQVPYTSDRFSNLTDIAIDGNGNLYVADSTPQIQIFSTVNTSTTPGYISLGSSFTYIAVNPSGTQIVGLYAAGLDGALYQYSNTTPATAPFNQTWSSWGPANLGRVSGPPAFYTPPYYPLFNGITCSTDGTFYGISPYGIDNNKNPYAFLYSLSNFSGVSSVTITGNTVDGVNQTSSTGNFVSITFKSGSVAYVSVNNGGSSYPVNLITLTGTNAFTTTTPNLYSGIDSNSALAVFSNSDNSGGVLVARIPSTSNGMNGYQLMY